MLNVKIHTLIILVLFLNACSTTSVHNEVEKNVIAHQIQYEMSESELLNVSIIEFKAGVLPKDKDKQRGLSEEIRNSEARYMPVHLKYTMQKTGYWGSVRVIPGSVSSQGNEGSEVIVSGEIISSDGESIELSIDVSDASNKKWFSKDYGEIVTADDQNITESGKKDRFQNLYNQISNDIIEYRKNLTRVEIKHIKEIAEIRFANYMAPEVFANYLAKNEAGIYSLKKLPADNDLMMQRIHAIKARDEMLVDTINNYYDIYYDDLWDSYDSWREFRSEELKTIREIEQKATTQKVLGVAAIVGAIALGASNNSRYNSHALETVLIAGGAYAIKTGFDTSKESEINKEAIEELGASFETEVEPILIDVNGKTMTLTGNAQQQYEKWRQLLKKIHIEETSF